MSANTTNEKIVKHFNQLSLLLTNTNTNITPVIQSLKGNNSGGLRKILSVLLPAVELAENREREEAEFEKAKEEALATDKKLILEFIEKTDSYQLAKSAKLVASPMEHFLQLYPDNKKRTNKRKPVKAAQPKIDTSSETSTLAPETDGNSQDLSSSNTYTHANQ